MNHRTVGFLAGTLWVGAGALLSVRGGLMLGKTETTWGLALALTLGLIVGAAKGYYVLSRSARRNLRRIAALDKPKPWNAFTLRFLFLLGLMIGFGRMLRWLASEGHLPWGVVGGIYVGIGVALVVSAGAYFIPKRPPLETRTPLPPPPRDDRVGVIVCNLGSPDAPDPRAVRRFLRQFLSDPRVVEVNRILWAFVLNVIILPWRSRASARAYAMVWDPDTGSPLLHWTRRIADSISEQLGDRFMVEIGMRYGNPGIEQAIGRIISSGCKRIVVLPLYPQFSNTTTGTTQAEVMRLAAQRRAQPAISFVPSYPEHPQYIEALADKVCAARGNREPDLYVFSFHGLPEAYVRKGDPYLEECTRTSFALADALGLERNQWEMVFQSRFGDEPWLEPALDEFVTAIATEKKRLLVVTPGFAADCLETLEEIAIHLRKDFLAAGGQELIVVPALNDHPVWIEALAQMVIHAPVRSPVTIP